MSLVFEVKAAQVTEKKSNDERNLLSKYTRSFQRQLFPLSGLKKVTVRRGYWYLRLLTEYVIECTEESEYRIGPSTDEIM